MNSMRIPTRRAPTVEDARRNQSNTIHLEKKKTPPPRPPPPNFGVAKSKSAWSLTQNDNTLSLIEWSPPNSPKPTYKSHSQFNGSISSSFSSSTSSLASSKKSYEFENVSDWMHVSNSTFYQKPPVGGGSTKLGPGPTIIRAAPPKKKITRSTASASTSREVSPLPLYFHTGTLTPTSASSAVSPENKLTESEISLPMPSIPPPSPPKDASTVIVPFAIALYDYNTGQQGDLQFKANDVIYLIKHINQEWMMGRTVDDREGMFPTSFIDIQVPLPQTTCIVHALYDFTSQVCGDLSFKAGEDIKLLRIIDNNWMEGECRGRRGQFPANFVDRLQTLN